MCFGAWVLVPLPDVHGIVPLQGVAPRFCCEMFVAVGTLELGCRCAAECSCQMSMAVCALEPVLLANFSAVWSLAGVQSPCFPR